MAILFDAPVTPDDATMYIRNVPFNSSLTLLNTFGVTTSTTNEVDLSEVISTNRAARFRAFDGRIHVADRDVASASRVRMAPFSDSLNMGEYERLQLEFARTGGTRLGALADAIYNDEDRLARNMHNRMELALADVLVDGKFTANLDTEFGGEADFGVDSANLPTAATPWSDKGADILGDLIAWCDAYEAVNGTRPARVLTSRAVLRNLANNTGLVNAVKGAQTGVTRITLADLTGLFTDNGLPTEWVANESQLYVDDTLTRVMPADKLTFLPENPSDLLEFRMGISATALELVDSNESDLSFEDAPGIVGVVEKVGPPYRQFTFVDAVGLPVLKDARMLFTADVL